MRAVLRLTCAADCGGYYFYEDAGEAFQLRAVDLGPAAYLWLGGRAGH